jgi:acyl-CoA thioester hydrolase
MTADSEAAPLRLHRATVKPEWIDYNGHMSEPYYVLVFGDATDAFYDHIGMDEVFRRATMTSVYTVEAHINYLSEVAVGEPLDIETQVLGHDAKRLVLFHTMRHGPGGPVLATTELMVLHVDKTDLKTCPFHPEPAARIAAISAAQTGLPAPKYAGRRIAVPQG